MRRNRGEVNDARREHDRRRRARQQAHQRPQAVDAAAFAGRGKAGQAKIGLGRVTGGNQRQAVAGRSRHQIEGRCGLEQRQEGVRRGQRPGRRHGAIEEHTPVLDSADVDADRSRVDADDAGHGSARVIQNAKCKMQIRSEARYN